MISVVKARCRIVVAIAVAASLTLWSLIENDYSGVILGSAILLFFAVESLPARQPFSTVKKGAFVVVPLIMLIALAVHWLGM